MGLSLFSIVLEFYLTTNDKNWLVVSIIMGIAAVAWGIITELGLLMSWLIMHDFPEYTAGEVIAASWNKMKGNRGRLFALEMSFIPFYLLGILSFGVAFIWITPYLLQSRTQFYLDLMNAKEVTYTWERTV